MLRERIARGAWLPGQRLPSYEQLLKELDVSRATLFQAVRELKIEGHLHTQGARGMFVAERPPHLARCALVTLSQVKMARKPLFFDTFLNAAYAVGQECDIEMVPYYGVSEEDGTASYRRLLSDLRRSMLAGIIFLNDPGSFCSVERSPLFADPALPRIAFTDRSLPGTVCLSQDRQRLAELTTDWLLERHRKRVAVLRLGDIRDLDKLCQGVSGRGVEFPPHWRFAFGQDVEYEMARQVTHLLLDRPIEQRPDALWVLDDHLLDFACRGVADAGGIEIGRDLDLVAMANLPLRQQRRENIKIIGFNAQSALRRAMWHITTRRSGQTTPDIELIAPEFADNTL